MASVDWQKIKGGTEAKAMFRHCDSEKRVGTKHTNNDIDVTRTHLNMSFGAFVEGYDAVCEAYDAYLAELDAKPGANKRKDRVTLVGWSIPAPDGLDDDAAREWFAEAYGVLREKYGDAVLGGAVHFDEVHEYTDAETGEKRVSRPHLHAYAVPDVGGKLNAKAFMARRNMVAMNDDMERMTQEHFPGHRFQTGAKKKSRRTVEELKQASDVRQTEADAQAEAAKIVEEARKSAESYKASAAMEYQDAFDMRVELSQTLEKARKDAEGIRAMLDRETASKTPLSASQSTELDHAKAFMKRIRYKDGTTALDRFEAEEHARAEQERRTQKVKQQTAEQLRTKMARLDMFEKKVQGKQHDGRGTQYGD